MFPILFKLGPITLHTYGLLVAIGFLVAYSIAKREFLRARLSVELLESGIPLLMVISLLGARVVYFAVEGFAGLREDPLSFFRIWEGGLVFYGGFLFGVAFVVVATQLKRLPLLVVMDALVPALLVGQALGRLGCFAAGCCYGRPTGHFWGVVFHHTESLAPQGISLIPTQLLSSGGDLLLLGAFFALRRVFVWPGFGAFFYLVGYGVVRFFLEFLRGDDRGMVVLGFYPSQWISLAAVIIGVFVFFYGRKKQTT